MRSLAVYQRVHAVYGRLEVLGRRGSGSYLEEVGWRGSAIGAQDG
jgi:hypothetical protein